MCCFRVPLLHSEKSIGPWRHAELFGQEQLHLCSSMCVNKTQAKESRDHPGKKNLNIYMYLQSLWLEYCTLSPRLPCSHPSAAVMPCAECLRMREQIQFICSNSFESRAGQFFPSLPPFLPPFLHGFDLQWFTVESKKYCLESSTVVWPLHDR